MQGWFFCFSRSFLSLTVAWFACLLWCSGLSLEQEEKEQKEHQPHRMSDLESVRDMFAHSMNNYLSHAFPFDELTPLSCAGKNTLGQYALTLLDSLDTLVLFGYYREFRWIVKWLAHSFTLDIDENVSVFETNIRLLGSLLSAHLLASDPDFWYSDYDDDPITPDINTIDNTESHSLKTLLFEQQCLQSILDGDLPLISNRPRRSHHFDDSSSSKRTTSELICRNFRPFQDGDLVYNDELLHLAVDLAERLIPAFESSKTWVPYNTVNLGRKAVPPRETPVTCTACAGSFLIEFGALTALSGDPRYYTAAKKAALQLYHSRHPDSGLLGTHLDSSKWDPKFTDHTSSVGTYIDSYLEYLLKAHWLFGDDELLQMFHDLFDAAWQAQSLRPAGGRWWLPTAMSAAKNQSHVPVMSVTHDSFASFLPGLLTMNGDFHRATLYLHSITDSIIGKPMLIPEVFDIQKGRPKMKREQYPLRPELIESLYYLIEATQDESYATTVSDIMHRINDTARVACGFATVDNVDTLELSDQMDSFWMSETLKYMFLSFANELIRCEHMIVDDNDGDNAEETSQRDRSRFNIRTNLTVCAHNHYYNYDDSSQSGISWITRKMMDPINVIYSTEGHVFFINRIRQAMNDHDLADFTSLFSSQIHDFLNLNNHIELIRKHKVKFTSKDDDFETDQNGHLLNDSLGFPLFRQMASLLPMQRIGLNLLNIPKDQRMEYEIEKLIKLKWNYDSWFASSERSLSLHSEWLSLMEHPIWLQCWNVPTLSLIQPGCDGRLFRSCWVRHQIDDSVCFV